MSTFLPLVVDLDGTLVRRDTLHVCFETLGRNVDFIAACQFPFWMRKGRAYTKHRLAQAAKISAACLPYHDDLVAYLTEEKARGRTLVLATGATEIIARGVADHVKLFTEVYASDEAINLVGVKKADLL